MYENETRRASDASGIYYSIERSSEERIGPNGIRQFSIYSRDSIQLPTDPQASVSVTIFNLINVIVGTAVVSYPYVCAITGLAAAWSLIILFTVMFYFSCKIYLKACDVAFERDSTHLRSASADKVVGVFLGDWGARAMAVCIVLGVFMACNAYLVLIADWISPILDQLQPDLQSHYNTRAVVVCFSCAFIIAPLSLFGELRKLAPFSFFAIGALWFLLFFIVSEGVQCVVSHAIATDVVWINTDHDMEHWYKWFSALPIIAFSFNGQPVLVPLYAELRTTDKPRVLGSVLFPCALCSALLYAVVGSFGYISHGGHVMSDILRMYSLGNHVADIARVALSLALMLHYAMVLFPLRRCLDAVFFPAHAPSTIRASLQTVVTVGLTALVSLMFPGVEAVFGLAGGTVGAMVSYVIPGLLLFKLPNAGKWDSCVGAVLVSWGVAFSILCVLAVLMARLFASNP
jgi:amino acid permease